MMRYLSTLALAVVASQGAAQQLAADGFSLPATPAFTYLGVSPTKISQPASPRDFGAALANALDSLGRTQQGFALDASLWTVFPVMRITNADYASKPGTFALANTQLSLGTVRAAGDTMSTDAALALRTNLVNHADPLRDQNLGTLIDAAVQKCQEIKDATGRPIGAEVEACSDKAVRTLVEEWKKTNWNALGFSVAAALGGRFEQSRTDRFIGRGAAAWAVLALPLLLPSTQLLAQVKLDFLRGGSSGQDTITLSSGLRFNAGGTRFNSYLEWGLSRQDIQNTIRGTWTWGLEFMAAEKLWLSTGVGSAFNERVKKNQTVLIADLRWYVADAPSFVAR